MNTERNFLTGKHNAILKLKKAKEENKVDYGIQSILDIINEYNQYYTSSSCFGRIVLLEIPSIGDKKEAKFLGKWHRMIDIDDLINGSRNAKTGQIWFLSQSPIIHVVAKSNDDAEKLLKNAIACGFKNSGLKSLGKKIVVEVCSTERLDAPIGDNGIIFCKDDHLELLVKTSNEIMNKSTLKLQKLEQKLKKDLNTYKTTI
jgi:tRNA wybutosine-synthesizing protein 3